MLAEIKATNPTLSELMRLCLLRAGLSRADNLSTFVLGNPKAWLGSAYHEVLTKMPRVDPANETADVAFERLWDQAIEARHQRARCHPLDHRFGAPSSWPGYYLIRESSRLRAREIANRWSAPRTRERLQHNTDMPHGARERRFVACGGRLTGRPDAVRGDTIVDYKSGHLFEDGNAGRTGELKAGFVRQLRIYAYLTKHNWGMWPRRGVVFPLAAEEIEINLDPEECEEEALEAIRLLDRYDEAVQSQQDPMALASPSCEACGWCSYKIVCSAFWQNATERWSNMPGGAAIEGILLEKPQQVYGGAAYSLPIYPHAGTAAVRRLDLRPMNVSIHSILSELAAGDSVRLVGLRRRYDGTLVPTLQTVLVPLSEIPLLQVKAPGRLSSDPGKA